MNREEVWRGREAKGRGGLVLRGPQDLARDVVVVAPVGMGTVMSCIRANGTLPLKSKTAAFDFKRQNSTGMRGILRRNLKEKYKEVKFLQDVWKQLKNTITEAQERGKDFPPQ